MPKHQRPHIADIFEGHQEPPQPYKLVIFKIISVIQTRDTILVMPHETDARVIDQYHIFQIPTFEYSQIFDHDPFSGLDTIIPKNSLNENFILWVYQVNHRIRVLVVRGCKHHQVKVIFQVIEQFHSIRSHIDPGLLV
jgi:hypothetical protein